jgi:hypothetical protein
MRARYWNQDFDLSPRLTGSLTVDLRELGLQLEKSGRVAIGRSGDLEWVDPVIGARNRHPIARQGVHALGDIGGFGAGSDFRPSPVALLPLSASNFRV